MGHMMGPAHIGPVPGITAPAHPGQPPFHGIHVQLGALPVGGGPPLPLGSDRVSPHGRYSAHRTCLFTPHTSHLTRSISVQHLWPCCLAHGRCDLHVHYTQHWLWCALQALHCPNMRFCLDRLQQINADPSGNTPVNVRFNQRCLCALIDHAAAGADAHHGATHCQRAACVCPLLGGTNCSSFVVIQTLHAAAFCCSERSGAPHPGAALFVLLLSLF